MHRVAVTGLGLVTPLGISTKKTWSQLISGKSGIRSTQILGREFESLPSKVAAWIEHSELESILELERDLRPLPKYINYALIAANEAIEDSGCNFESLKEQAGVCVGSGMAPLDIIGESFATLTNVGVRRVSPHLIPRILPNMPAGHISIRHKISGPLLSPSSACATGSNAIGDAFRLIKHGYAKVMVAGGTEAAVNPLSIAGFCQAKALSVSFNSVPSQSSRPFDKDRDGFVIGEGAGIVVLEEFEMAKSRGAKIYGEILGYGCSADTSHITASHPEGKGAVSAMIAAIKEANVSPTEVDLVNAHATSTPIGDKAESIAINRVFDQKPLLVSANKGAFGHLLGAAGAVEAIITILSLNEGIVPPNHNLKNPETICTFELLKSGPISNLQIALSNSFGFGGANTTLCFVK